MSPTAANDPSRLDTDVLVVGAGPAGSAAAAWAARHGLDVLLVDAATFPRDKPCGDGLTPRAIAELTSSDWPSGWRGAPATGACGPRASAGRCTCRGLAARCRGHGSAAPRLELDARDPGRGPRVRRPGARGLRAVDVRREGGQGPRRSCSPRDRAARHPSRRSPAGGSWSPTGPAHSWAGCSGGLAPQHRLRGGRPRLHRLRSQRRCVDLLAPGAAGHRRASCSPATAGSSRWATAR